MTDVPPEIAALLDRARHAHDPSEDDQARVHRSLVVALAAPALGAGLAGGGAGGASGAASSAGGVAAMAPGAVVAAGAGKVGLTLGAKVALGSLVLAGLGGAVAVLPRAPAKDLSAAHISAPQREHAEPRVAGAEPQQLPPSRAPMQQALPIPATAEPGAEGPAEHPGVRAHRPERMRHDADALAAHSAVTTPVAVVEPGPVAAPGPVMGVSALEELKLIRRATRLLRDGDARGALATLKEHAARHPDGALGLERDGLRVLALCAIEPNGEARELRAKFLDHHGASTMALRVRAACEPKAEPGAAK